MQRYVKKNTSPSIQFYCLGLLKVDNLLYIFPSCFYSLMIINKIIHVSNLVFAYFKK